MNRRAIVALILCLAAASPSVAKIRFAPTNRFTISDGMNERFLAVSNGEVYLRQSEEGIYWYILGTQIKSSVPGGGYLAYDPKGKTNLVGLADRPGKGTEWSIDVPSSRRGSERDAGFIRAAHGPKKGWYLTVADGCLILAEDPPQKLYVQRYWRRAH